MFKKTEFEKCVSNASEILITSHIYPDADAVCSAQLLKMMIKKTLNKDCDICIATEIGKLLKPFNKDIININSLTKTYDLVICVDCTDTSRIEGLIDRFNQAKTTINIDHHITNSNFATINIVDPTASSTCEIIYNICLENYADIINPQMARYAYAGIITDTNALMNNNIQPKTYSTIANITNHGLNVDIIKNYFFKTYTKAKIQLFAKALSSINFYDNNKIALISISSQDIIDCEASLDDTLGMVDYALNCYLVDIAIAIIEKEPHNFHVSLHSKKTNVATIANTFGGGGHENISAFQTTGELNEIIDKLIEEFSKINN